MTGTGDTTMSGPVGSTMPTAAIAAATGFNATLAINQQARNINAPATRLRLGSGPLCFSFNYRPKRFDAHNIPGYCHNMPAKKSVPAKKPSKITVRRDKRVKQRVELKTKLKKKVMKRAKEKPLSDDEVTRQALAAHFGGAKPKQAVPTGYEGLKRLVGPGFVGVAVLGTEMTDGDGQATVGKSLGRR